MKEITKPLYVKFTKKSINIKNKINPCADYEKIEIRKCPSIAEAFKMIDDPAFKSAFKANEHAIAIVIKINGILKEDDANTVQLLSLNDTRPMLIAFESTDNGQWIIYWRTKDMNFFLKVILDRIEEGNKTLYVPSDFLIDSFLIKCIKLNDNGLSPTDDARRYQCSSVPLDCLYNAKGCNLLMVSFNKNNQNAFEYFRRSIFDLKFCPDKGHKHEANRSNTIQAFNISYLSNPAYILSKMKQNTSFEKIVIEKCPSTADAFKMIEKPVFRSEFKANKSAIAIVLKIDDKLNENEANKVQSLNLDASNPRALLIAFGSTVDGSCIVYWRTKDMKELLSTKLDRIHIKENLFFPVHSSVSSILIDSFLIPSMKANHNCLSPEDDLENYENNFMPLHCLYNPDKFNLLMISVEKNEKDAVDYFLKTSIDVNYFFEDSAESDEGWLISKRRCKSIILSAATVAHMKNYSSILFKLLNNNSLFPDNFNLELASSKIQKFVEETLKFHEFIKSGNLRKCKKFIKSHQGMKYFFDTENNSAAKVALECRNISIYELLVQNSIHVAPHEKLNQVFADKSLSESIFKIHRKYSLDIDDYELYWLLSRTKLSHDNSNIPNALSHIEKAYRYLLDISEIKILLKLAVAHDKYFILADLNRDSAQFLLAKETDLLRGAVTYSKMICFGARELLINYDKYIVYGTIGHEFGHVGIVLVFRNKGKPFSFGDKVAEEKFNAIVENIRAKIKGGRNVEGIVKAVFACNILHANDTEIKGHTRCYTPEKFAAELIVRVPHIIATYKNKPKELEKCKEEFKDLFDFYESEVLPKMHEALPFIKTLSNENNSIKWSDLPTSLRVTCKNKKLVKFQGEYVSLYDIAGRNEGTIYSSLSSDIIRGLIEGKTIEIGEELEEIEIYVERKLVDKKTNSESYFNNLTSTERLVLLSDEAGAGKTTTFKYFSKKFKEDQPGDWVLYVDLKKYFKFYEEMKDKSINVVDILVEIHELEDWSKIVFKELFDSGRVTVFWDGLDEINTEYKEFMTKIVKDFYETSNNRQWISSRPQHIEHFEEIFQTPTYKLIPYDQNDRKKFLRKYLTEMKLESAENEKIVDNTTSDVVVLTKEGCLTEKVEKILKIDTIIEKIEDFIKLVEHKDHENINNPQMLKMIADICSQPEFNFNLQSNQFSIFQFFIDTKYEGLVEKGKFSQKYAELKKVHQKFALKYFFGERFNRLYEKHLIFAPEIMKYKYKLSLLEISSFGFIRFVDKKNFNFVHKSFAEFFVAQYLIENLYNLDEFVHEEEIIRRLMLHYHITFDEYNCCHGIRKFIEHFFNLEDCDLKKSFKESVNKFLRSKFENILSPFSEKFPNGKFSKLSSKNKITLNSNWNVYMQMFKKEILKRLFKECVKMEILCTIYRYRKLAFLSTFLIILYLCQLLLYSLMLFY